MEGPLCVVTGANSGIGREMSRQLAAGGARVLMVCRNPQRGQEALAWVNQSARPDAVELFIADLSSMAEVRALAQRIRQRHARIDVLLNNAGVYLPTRALTSEGFERMFALNHLAPFLLTHELLEPLLLCPNAKVITTSSEGHRLGHIAFDDLQAERRFGALRQYSNTKLANILFTRELARRFGPRGLRAHSFHPGAVKTGFAQDEMGAFGWVVKLVGPLLRSSAKAARIGVHLATSDEALERNGLYWVKRGPRAPSREARSAEAALRLWDVSERLLGLGRA
jgi:retinol dehydrogenase 12